MTKSTSNLAVRAAAFGVGGFVVENTFFGPRYSALFGGIAVPVLPVYAAGGLAVQAIAPHIRDVSFFGRAAIYAAALSGIELAGCWFDRDVLGACSWDYSKHGCKKSLAGCIDLKHAALWGALGMLVEGASK